MVSFLKEFYRHLDKYSWFPLFDISMFYKLTTNPDLVNIEPLLLRNTGLSSCKPLVAIFVIW